MLRFHVIVVPTDLSDYSLRALPYAVSLAERFRAKLKLLFVNEPSLQLSDVVWSGVDRHAVDGDHLARIRRYLAQIAVERVPSTVPVDAEIIAGDSVESIIDYAAANNADLIVMATHGRGGLSHVLMGSTAEAVVRKAHCPVLTLKQPMPVEIGVED